MRNLRNNKKTRYVLLTIALILVSIFLLNGGHWINGMGDNRGFTNISVVNWTHVLFSVFIGFGIGFGIFVAKRRL